jgi:hypothetical protein
VGVRPGHRPGGRRHTGRPREIEERAIPFFERLADRGALLAALRDGEIRTSQTWTAAIAAWAGDRGYADRVLADALAGTVPGKGRSLFRRRAAIIAEALGLDFTDPDGVAEKRLVVTMVCPDDATRDETDDVYWKLYSGLMRALPDDGSGYLFHVESVVQGRTEAILFGPDRDALVEYIRPLLDAVAVQRAGSGHPHWTVF